MRPANIRSTYNAPHRPVYRQQTLYVNKTHIVNTTPVVHLSVIVHSSLLLCSYASVTRDSQWGGGGIMKFLSYELLWLYDIIHTSHAISLS
jgi:hypothetical protein